MANELRRQIIVHGGGGFSKYGSYTPSNLLIEKYFLKQTQIKCPRICFVPTASGESQKYIVDFYRAFGSLECKPSCLSLFDPPSSDLESYLLEYDAIYVGGGNTKSMLALWKEWKLDVYLKKAWNQGVVLGGISAGGLCWFEEGVTDSIPGSLTSLKCLGFLPGSHCPHYDGEVERRPAYHRMIKEGMASGIAADDHVALHYVDEKLEKVVKANAQGAAYRVQVLQGQVVEQKIEAVELFIS
jgi:dipeptidase E